MPPHVPHFDPAKDRYDMDTLWGRLLHRYRLIDPRGLFVTEATLRQYQEAIAKAGKGDKGGHTDAELWDMKFAVEGSVHPTTNEVISPLFRMSAYVPVNIPIVTSMTMPAVIGSPAATMFVHWFNQSYNCAVNYANRSGDSQSVDGLFKAYVAAVTVSLAGGLGATYAMKKMGGGGGMGATIVRATLPFTAVVASGCANVSIMRWGEWQVDGVPVMDDEGTVRGKSLVAGTDGLMKCWFARFAWNVPPMVLPPLLAIPLASVPFLAKRMRFVEAGLCLGGISFGVPLALAYFKPYTTISADALEPQFHHLTNSKGLQVKEFTFYKGI
jgi:tricarboxylate carrier